MRMPGFRAGNVPLPVVIKRFGREVVLDEAVRGSLGEWYLEAHRGRGIHPGRRPGRWTSPSCPTPGSR